MALTYTPPGELNSPLPGFRLPGVDGKTYEPRNFSAAKALVVMFICNHCPYVKAVEDRLIETSLRLKGAGVECVAICSNDPEDYPEDNFDALKARWLQKGYPFPYLHDVDQSAAKAFGAVCTPDLFIFDQDRRLAYRGRLDDSWKDASKVTKRELEEAALRIARGQPIEAPQVPSMGCSIKWRKL